MCSAVFSAVFSNSAHLHHPPFGSHLPLMALSELLHRHLPDAQYAFRELAQLITLQVPPVSLLQYCIAGGAINLLIESSTCVYRAALAFISSTSCFAHVVVGSRLASGVAVVLHVQRLLIADLYAKEPTPLRTTL